MHERVEHDFAAAHVDGGDHVMRQRGFRCQRNGSCVSRLKLPDATAGAARAEPNRADFELFFIRCPLPNATIRTALNAPHIAQNGPFRE